MDDIEMFFEGNNVPCYLESLVKCRALLEGHLKEKLDEVISAELDLALMGAEKAKSEILKKDAKSTVRPIK
jgi:hypothetical protein